MFSKDAGVAEAIIKKSALKFLEHISANTPKFILIDFNFAKTLKHPDRPPLTDFVVSWCFVVLVMICLLQYCFHLPANITHKISDSYEKNRLGYNPVDNLFLRP